MSGERHLQLRSSVKFCKDACCHILVAVLGKLPSAEEITKPQEIDKNALLGNDCLTSWW